jgi:hypothetical protein
VFQLLERIEMNMVEKKWSPLGSIRKTQGIFQHHQTNNLEVNPLRLHHPRPKGPNQTQVVVPHLIQ